MLADRAGDDRQPAVPGDSPDSLAAGLFIRGSQTSCRASRPVSPTTRRACRHRHAAPASSPSSRPDSASPRSLVAQLASAVAQLETPVAGGEERLTTPRRSGRPAVGPDRWTAGRCRRPVRAGTRRLRRPTDATSQELRNGPSSGSTTSSSMRPWSRSGPEQANLLATSADERGAEHARGTRAQVAALENRWPRCGSTCCRRRPHGAARTSRWFATTHSPTWAAAVLLAGGAGRHGDWFRGHDAGWEGRGAHVCARHLAGPQRRYAHRRGAAGDRGRTPGSRESFVTVVAFQGELGANSQIAIREAFPGADPLPCPTFEDAFSAVREGVAPLAMIPIENSLAGRVSDIYHLLPVSGLSIIGEHFLPIRHQLLGVPGATLADLRTVESHVDGPRPVPQRDPAARPDTDHRRRHGRVGARGRRGRRTDAGRHRLRARRARPTG